MDCINEESSALYTASVKDPAGQPVTAARLLTLTLTLYDPDSDAIVNGRDAQNVLNDNDVTIASDGTLSWAIQPEDTIVLDDTKLRETRHALFIFTWDGGQHHHEYRFQVRNLQLVEAEAVGSP